MTGGLLQLISSGSQDIFLTKNPEFTFFKLVYHRYTNFSRFNDTIIFDNKISFNSINKINIHKNGDLIIVMGAGDIWRQIKNISEELSI